MDFAYIWYEHVWRAYDTQFSHTYDTHLPHNPNHTHRVAYTCQSPFLRINTTSFHLVYYLREKKIIFICHIHLYREYITSSEMYSLHLTHPKWTHTRSSGQPCYSARGAVGGLVPCSRTPQSWYWRLFTPPSTIPAGPEIRTYNLWITSPTL